MNLKVLKCAAVFVAILLVTSYGSCDEEAKTKDIDEFRADMNSNELDGAEDIDKPEMETGSELNSISNDKRAIYYRCWCWIGWRKKEGRKYKNFGRIRRYKWYVKNKQGKCSASCAAKCAPWLKKKSFLCRKIGKNYDHKQNKVGCFSKLGLLDLQNNIWDFDGVPHKLCCKRYRKKCKDVYGAGYFYSSSKKMCLLKIHNSCLPGLTPGKKEPPVCCFWNKTYSCQKRKYGTKSVNC